MAVNLSPLAIAMGSWVAGLDGKLRGADPTGALGGTPEGREAIMLALGVDVNPTPTGTTYYLDNTHGSASDSNPGTSASAPWLTLNKAITTLVAGEMVIGKGTYSHASAILPTNSGTSGNPIIYRAETSQNFIIDQLNTNDGFRLDANSINYTVFDDMEIKNVKGADGGGGVFTKDDNLSIHVLNCHIHHIDCQEGGNAGGVRFDKQTGGVIYNSYIHDVTVKGIASNNAASIHGYGHNEAIIAFNRLYNSNHGIDSKGFQLADIWRVIGNDIDATADAIYINVIGGSNPAINHTNTEMYNNIFRTGLVNIECDEHNPQSENFIFRNNVLGEQGIKSLQMKALEIYDNIFDFLATGNEAGTTITTARRDRSLDGGTISTITYCDYNNYSETPNFTTNQYAIDGGSEVTRMNLATWQAQSAGDGFGTIQVNSPDTNATTVDPEFDGNMIAQSTSLATAGRFGGRTGLEYQAGPDWSVA